MSSNAIYSKANDPLSVKGTDSARLKVAGGIWKACTWNHSKSLGYFLIALSCPASAILNASSGLFSIFKPSQQQGIVFPVNIALWLFIYRLPNHALPQGRGSSCIAPRSRVRQGLVSNSSPEGGTNLLSGICFAFSLMLTQLCLQARWGREGVQITLHPGKQHSNLQRQILPLHLRSR